MNSPLYPVVLLALMTIQLATTTLDGPPALFGWVAIGLGTLALGISAVALLKRRRP